MTGEPNEPKAMSEAAPASGPHVVARVDDLIALQPGSVVLDSRAEAWRLNEDMGERFWKGTGCDSRFTTAELWQAFNQEARFTVIYEPSNPIRPSAPFRWRGRSVTIDWKQLDALLQSERTDWRAPEVALGRGRTTAAPPNEPGNSTNEEHPMAAPSKIVDEQEVIRWIGQGKTYRWIQQEYLRKYSIETTLSMWSNFRLRRGLERRTARDTDLIPWAVEPRHRNNYYLAMLRVEARRRAGLDLRKTDESRLVSWPEDVAALNAVVLYDHASPDGFYLVPREMGDDGLIRRPTDSKHQTRRGRAD